MKKLSALRATLQPQINVVARQSGITSASSAARPLAGIKGSRDRQQFGLHDHGRSNGPQPANPTKHVGTPSSHHLAERQLEAYYGRPSGGILRASSRT